MKNILSIYPNLEVRSIAIGKFDGLHLAHQEIFRRVLQKGDGAIVFIRSKHQNRFLTPNSKEYLCDYFGTLMCERMAFLSLHEICDMECHAFMDLLRAMFPRLEKIVVGYDFRFGKNRMYSIADLESGFDVEIVEQVLQDGKPVHSQKIIEYLGDGKIELANALLGREYMIWGEVVSGQGRGGREFVPTLNLSCEDYVLPQSGVYATWSEWEGVRYLSVSFLGHRVSTDGQYGIETHVLDTPISYKPKNMKIYFVSKIRDNQKFDELSLLKAQILEDISKAKMVLKGLVPHKM